ncbi:amino acid ABC transporter substrate-binding protein (plasmid) [Alicycliphilus denitrificans]|uniref:Amino acid ABC transporter substrate-binding protein n=1 Tax=Alicycliphilus denitrificans TaxID=179636 RepID=A0A858ZMW1_9BURK|nr:amino acid ABC transporter substrate-binding protein [Alicycliphilus denitrificans]QKD42096.1 amino acid ABC transporter substrate-binding protein [Alicycliphilus denitrificans]QKD42125.1 amino acid ABC transporter substrate-binding protein [Alicycliphilus denitrificans]
MNKWKSVLRAFAVAGISVLANTAYSQETIRFGAPLALTGSLADAGAKSKQGYDMCVSAVNAKGGVNVGGQKRKLELVEYDYQSETNRAVQIVQRLINVDKVPFLFAPYGSGDTKATAVVAERYGVPMMAASAATVSVFDQNFQNLYGVLFPNAMITDQEVAYQKKHMPDVKKVAVLALNSLFPRSIANDFVNSAKAGGYDVAFNSIYSHETADFSTVLTQIKTLKPDWVYITGYTQNLILIRRQMADIGLDAKVVTMTSGPAYPEYVDNLKALAENVTTNAWWHQNADYKDDFLFGSSMKYNQAFRERYKRDATYLEASATVSCQILAMAIEAANSTAGDAVRKALRERKFDTFYGPVQFDKSGQNNVNAALVMQIQKGKLTVLAPEALKQGTVIPNVPPAR